MKYPFMRPIEQGCPEWMDQSHYRAIRKLAAEVLSRTHAHAWIDVIGRVLLFGYKRRDDDVGVCLQRELYKSGCSNAPWRGDPLTDGEGVDRIVWEINLGKVDPKTKRAWQKYWDELRESEERSAQRAAMDQLQEPAQDLIAHRLERASMGKHYKGSAMVNGLKD